MATKRPRVQVLLDEDTKALYDEAAAMLGVPTSRLIAQLCDDSAPAFVAIVDAYKKSRSHADPTKVFLDMAKDYVVQGRQTVSDAQLDIEDVISSHGKKNRSKGN